MRKPKMIFGKGKYHLELKNFRLISGHDDSLPFEADMYCNGRFICHCWNDGWGADACVKPNIDELALFVEVQKEVNNTSGLFERQDWYYTIPIVCDLLGCEWSAYQEIQKAQRTQLVFKKPDGSTIAYSFNRKGDSKAKVSVADMLRTISGAEMVRETIKKYTALGYELLNTNIRYPKVVLK
jgi:hypothetical protein